MKIFQTIQLSLFALVIAPAGLGLISAAQAEPILRQSVDVTGDIVTVGDMLADAGVDATRPIFRAPLPGTAGLVPVGTIAAVLEKLGIDRYENPGFLNVRVARDGVVVDADTLQGLVTADLTQRGILAEGMSVELTLSAALPTIYAAVSAEPVHLADLRYTQGSGRFAARFELSGVARALEVDGRLNLMIEAPHLTASLPSGAILQPGDITMNKVPLRLAESGGIAAVDQLVGKQLRHSSRIGMMVKPADVMEPELIARNDIVTVFLKDGPLMLTVKGQALNDAALGDTVSVLNLNSKKVVQGTAVDRGSVQVGGRPLELANL